MNYSLLSNFPEHLSITFDSFQFIVGAILVITSTTCCFHSRWRSMDCIIWWFVGFLIAGESYKTGALLSSDLLIALGGIIGYQVYMIKRYTYKRLLRRFGKEYVQPAWVAWLCPQVFPGIAIVLGMAAFVLIHDLLF